MTTITAILLIIGIPVTGGLITLLCWLGLSKYFAWKERIVYDARRKELDRLLDYE